jgi:uncharacterized protein YjbJ (UPF0337 family)
MNREFSDGQWSRLKDNILEFWSVFTEDDVRELDGRYERLAGKVREKYGLGREDAEELVDDFLDIYEL